MRTAYKGRFSKDYILSISKTINGNGCWIPFQSVSAHGYVRVGIGGRLMMLHRVSLSLWHNIDYNDLSIDTLHDSKCDKRCFNPEHVRPGTHLENMRDNIHHNSKKEVCPKCGGMYSIVTCRKGMNKGRIMRRCNNCRRSQ